MEPPPVTEVACTVWWASVHQLSRAHLALLSEDELRYARGKRQPADQTRSMLAAAVLRLVVGRRTGTPPERVLVERQCPDCGGAHGRPYLPGSALHTSVSHSGRWVAVALTEAGAIGVDVEQRTAIDLALLAPAVLAPDERLDTSKEFFAMWTRKEAVVKATGEGLRAPLTAVRVEDVDRRPVLREYPKRPGLGAQLFDLAAKPGYTAAIAVLSTTALRVLEEQATAVLGETSRQQG